MAKILIKMKENIFTLGKKEKNLHSICAQPIYQVDSGLPQPNGTSKAQNPKFRVPGSIPNKYYCLYTHTTLIYWFVVPSRI